MKFSKAGSKNQQKNGRGFPVSRQNSRSLQTAWLRLTKSFRECEQPCENPFGIRLDYQWLDRLGTVRIPRHFRFARGNQSNAQKRTDTWTHLTRDRNTRLQYIPVGHFRHRVQLNRGPQARRRPETRDAVPSDAGVAAAVLSPLGRHGEGPVLLIVPCSAVTLARRKLVPPP